MDSAKLRQELEDLIEGIQSHLSNTKEFNPIPSLELQLIVSKIEKLHQKAIIFQYLNQNAPAIASVETDDELGEVEEEMVENEVKEVEKVEVKKVETEVRQVELEVKQVEQAAEMKKAEVEQVEEKIKQERIAVQEKKTTEHNNLSSVEATPNVQVSHEIRRFIGINDKFLFINQLFQQKADKYESALDRINQCPSIEKAVVLLNQLAEELNWTADNELTEAFFAIVRRTFGK